MPAPLRKMPWRRIEIAPDLPQALARARAGQVCRVQLEPGARVRPGSALKLGQMSEALTEFEQRYLRRGYWAAPLEAVLVPRATFFSRNSLVLIKDRFVCDELDFSANVGALPGVTARGERFRLDAELQQAQERAEHVPGVSLLLQPRARRNYFHWHTEALTQIPFALANAELIDSIALSRVERFQVDSWQSQGVEGFAQVPLAESGAWRFDVLIVLTHLFFNTQLHPATRPALQRIRASSFERFGITPQRGRPLFLSRGERWTRRPLTNQAELCRRLADLGFDIVEPGELDYAAQVRTLSQAGLLVAAHGSGLMNLLYLPQGVPVVELRPDNAGERSPLMDNFARVLCDLLQQPYGALFYPNAPGREEWEVDVDHVCAQLQPLLP